MENYRKSSHCTYDIKYHLVWITKYRKPVITGKIALRTRELIRIVCQSWGILLPAAAERRQGQRQSQRQRPNTFRDLHRCISFPARDSLRTIITQIGTQGKPNPFMQIIYIMNIIYLTVILKYDTIL